jgi:hypothetical protein
MVPWYGHLSRSKEDGTMSEHQKAGYLVASRVETGTAYVASLAEAVERARTLSLRDEDVSWGGTDVFVYRALGDSESPGTLLATFRQGELVTAA